jgi:hypothetical protein
MDPADYQYFAYLTENCFEIPSALELRNPEPPYELVLHEVAPGDVLRIRVEPDLGVLLFGWWCNTKPMPTPSSTIGAKTGTFTVTE